MAHGTAPHRTSETGSNVPCGPVPFAMSALSFRMTDLDRRIAQFQNMAQADPDNEMAHFSLGKALFDAGRFDEAGASFVRCTELAPQMSKAFQMAAECFLKSGNKDMAAQLATRGFTIAAERGDLMPKNAMAD